MKIPMTLEGVSVAIAADFATGQFIKSLAVGARWDDVRRVWRVSCDAVVVSHVEKALREQGHFCIPCDGVMALLENAAKQSAGAFPDYDPSKTYDIPSGVQGSPWGHQRYGVERVAKTNAFGVFWGMGSGKSRVPVDASHHLDLHRVLIVCPLSVIATWVKQFDIYGDPLVARSIVPLVKITKNGPKGVGIERGIEMVNEAISKGGRFVVIVNYDSAWRDELGELLASTKWDMVALDEAHRVKDPATRVGKWLAKLQPNAGKRLALTGTPMSNGPLDVFGIARFLDPQLFGPSITAFRARYAVQRPIPGTRAQMIVGYKNLPELSAKVATIASILRTADLVDLPDSMHTRIPVTLEPETRGWYDELDKELVAEIANVGFIDAANAMVKVLRLQQITGGYGMVDPMNGEEKRLHQTGTEKKKALEEIFQDIDINEPIPVFYRFKGDLENIREAAKACKRRCMELRGGVNELAPWQDAKGGEVIAVQMRSGGVGVDLTRACYQVYYSPGHSLGDYEQSLARTHRPGQTRKVCYFHLVAVNTVDEDVYDALQNKADIVESVIGRRGGQVKGKIEVDPEEMAEASSLFVSAHGSAPEGLKKGPANASGRQPFRLA